MASDFFIVRVLHVKEADGGSSVILLTGDKEFAFFWADAPPSVGDLYSMEAGQPPRVIAKIGGANASGWSVQGDGMRWRQRGNDGLTRMGALWKRHVIRRSVRDYLDAQGFIELDCPLLVKGTTPDAAIQSFQVGEMYLSTSTELQMRRLEVGGFEKLYTLTQNFRAADGEGSTHNPEFTMLEWVRVGASLEAIEADTEQLVWQAHLALGGNGTLNWNGHQIALEPPWERITMEDAVHARTGVRLRDYSLHSILEAIAAAKLPLHPEWHGDRVFLFSLLVDHVQSSLGTEKPVFIRAWPAFQTSSAAPQDGLETTDRSEAIICGLELSNGFVSLSDYEGQKASSAAQLERRRLEGKTQVALDQAYLDALRLGMPQDSAMALGFDRLCMLLTGQTEIRSVLALAWDEL